MAINGMMKCIPCSPFRLTVSPPRSIIPNMNEHNKKAIIANPLVILREEFDDRAILFDPETGNTFGINPIGVLVWKHLDGRHSLFDIAQIVYERAEAAPSDVTSHIENFVKAVVDLGLAGYKVK
jgi:SynChlorMet cassette protein ScmD